MADVVVKKCDECGTLEDVVRYVLGPEDETVKVDLCPEDRRKPLDALLEAHGGNAPAKSSRPARSSSTKRGSRMRVVDSMEELEDLKARGQI